MQMMIFDFSKISHQFSLILLLSFPGFVISAEVTLKSIEIFKSHEALNTKPTVYFTCKGDQNRTKTELPDVKQPNVTYSFKSEESWQPLTHLTSKKCKRCGFYEKDTFKSDDVFEEFELCPSDFKGSDGKYRRIKEKEFDATFSCPECVTLLDESGSRSSNRTKGMHLAVVILVGVALSVLLVVALAAGYKYWRKKKRQREQARFLKLFEDVDDLEDELELGNVM